MRIIRARANEANLSLSEYVRFAAMKNAKTEEGEEVLEEGLACSA